VAALLRAPVVLVVDAASQARSVAALVHGFATFDPRVRIGGVVLNRVGTDRHEAILREALRTVRALGAVVEAGIDLDAVLRLARTAPDLPGEAWDPAAEVRPVADRPV